MGRKSMPNKEKILEYWSDKLWDAPDNTSMCWGCGFSGYVERCHLVAHFKTKNNDPSNLVLLCKRCHRLQEFFCEMAGVDRFVELLKDGALFMPMALQEAKFIHNLMEETKCHS